MKRIEWGTRWLKAHLILCDRLDEATGGAEETESANPVEEFGGEDEDEDDEEFGEKDEDDNIDLDNLLENAQYEAQLAARVNLLWSQGMSNV